MISEPRFEELREAEMIDEELRQILIENTVESLQEQDGESLEERWNNLMKSHGFTEICRDEVLLEAWNDPSVRSNNSSSSTGGANRQQSLSSLEDEEK